MPPRRGRTNTNPLPKTQEELNERISQAIAQYEANRAEQSRGTGGTTGGNPPTGNAWLIFNLRDTLIYSSRALDTHS